ncbi:hypothetical protein J4Q44_G00155910 [Coregonus suidteri]|uniref:deoxyhypusine monooxygenase n=1 Tax=Coregonus suidteri TaxID=861788 RepID=A0AAN8LMS6_9TELE
MMVMTVLSSPLGGRDVPVGCQAAGVADFWWGPERRGGHRWNLYCSVDPAPPAQRKTVPELRTQLLDERLQLFECYRAMFALRNLGNKEAVLALGDGLQCSSALFRHEIGYVLGQIQHPAIIPQLQAALELEGENAMVRHECAEAMGAIGKEECMKILERYRKDAERGVKESCEVALDMLEDENGTRFQYADGRPRLQGPNSKHGHWTL